MSKFDDFMRELEEEAKADGPEAVAQIERFRQVMRSALARQPIDATCVVCGKTVACTYIDGSYVRPVLWQFRDVTDPFKGKCEMCQDNGRCDPWREG